MYSEEGSSDLLPIWSIFCALWIGQSLIVGFLIRAFITALHPFMWSDELKRLKEISRLNNELTLAERAGE